MEIKIPEVQLLRKRKDWRDPMSAATERPHLTTILMNNILKPFSTASYSKWDDNHVWSCQE